MGHYKTYVERLIDMADEALNNAMEFELEANKYKDGITLYKYNETIKIANLHYAVSRQLDKSANMIRNIVKKNK